MSFRSDLEKMGACDGALEWVGERALAEAWAECPRGDWMGWLCGRLALWTLETEAECEHVRAPAWAEYQRVQAQVWAEHDRASAQAWAECQRVRDQAWAECQRVRAQAVRDLVPFAEVEAAWKRLRAPGGGA